MDDSMDPDRARRLALLHQVEGELAELFAHANAQPEPKRTEARTFLRDLFTRAAGATSAPMSGPRKAEPRLVVAPPANDGSKGPPCARFGGSGQWKGRKGGSGACFECHGSGVQRERAGARR